MRSLFATLLSLVLPAGAVTGTRLVLDGVNGRIEAYDAFNDRVIVIDPFQIRAQVSDTGAFVQMDPTTASLLLSDALASQPAVLTATTVAGARRLSVRSPYDALVERASVVLDSDNPSTIRLEADQLQVSADVAPTISDTTDASGFVTFAHGAQVTPKTVVAVVESPSSAPACWCTSVDNIGATTARARFLAFSGGVVSIHATAAVDFRVFTVI